MQQSLDLLKIRLSELDTERARVTAAIGHLTGEKRRGRPPKNGVTVILRHSDALPESARAIRLVTPSKPKARGWTPEQRAAKAKQMRAFWKRKRAA